MLLHQQRPTVDASNTVRKQYPPTHPPFHLATPQRPTPALSHEKSVSRSLQVRIEVLRALDHIRTHNITGQVMLSFLAKQRATEVQDEAGDGERGHSKEKETEETNPPVKTQDATPLSSPQPDAVSDHIRQPTTCLSSSEAAATRCNTP